MKTDFIVFTDGTPANEFMLAYAAVLAARWGPRCTWCTCWRSRWLP
ncbi:hypothetical protein GKZ68_00095 [Hymenobacter sp. BRD128]|nr:hypothetical protein [Hymenobacter sp. BRD128]QKG55178.1 hypothetical protein GKZ68_00095 [Hymenobacter sp. BRD128]